jgi:phosphoribosyl-ATP pyrophosphohydrolase
MKKTDINKIVGQLEKNISARKKANPEKSYVAKLFKGGEEKIGRKISEEAVEVLIAAMNEPKKRIISESADLLFHLAVLLSHKKIKLEEVFAELESRLGISGLDEKASRIAKKKGK